MTSWIERYRRQAEERYRRLDAVLAGMDDESAPPTTTRREEPHHDHHHPATDPNGTTIEADPNLPVITIVRDFDAPADKVYRAWTDPELVVQWLGPNRSR